MRKTTALCAWIAAASLSACGARSGLGLLTQRQSDGSAASSGSAGTSGMSSAGTGAGGLATGGAGGVATGGSSGAAGSGLAGQAGSGCPGVCTLGVTECAGTALVTCRMASNGCPELGPLQACPLHEECGAMYDTFECVCSAGYVRGPGGNCGAIGTPRLIAPLSTATVSSRFPLLSWEPASGSEQTLIEICPDSACQQANPFFALGSSASVPFKLSPSVTYWRASGVNLQTSATSSPIWELFVGARDNGAKSAWGTTLDVNRDGSPDVLVGANTSKPGVTGSAFLYLGSANGLSNAALPLAAPDSNGGFGGVVASAGDVNGDGFGDVLIGASALDANTGAAYLYLGGANGLAGTPIKLPSPDGPGGAFGFALSAVGDVNGDGYGDVLIGEAFEHGHPGAYLYLGNASAELTAAAVAVPTNLANPLTESIASAGDLNGDGFADAVVGMTDMVNGGGEAYVFLGSPSGFLAPVTLTSQVGPGLGFAPSVSCAGDVNGDGYADLLIGTQTELGTLGDGNAFLYLGSPGGITLTPITVPIPGGPIGGFAYTVGGVGDLNGDGFADFAIGGLGGNGEQGFVDVYLGGASGPSAPSTLHGPTQFFFGSALAAGGDLDRDGFGELLIGAPGGGLETGLTAIYFGAANGLRPLPTILDGSEIDSQFGVSVASRRLPSGSLRRTH